jgi:hypothetical protein
LLGGQTRTPRLRAIKLNNRTAVYFSPEDISAGLVGQQVDGIYGYSPATATAIMEHILVQASDGSAVAPVSPGAPAAPDGGSATKKPAGAAVPK